MDRVNAVQEHPLYREYYERLEKLEEGRIFCRHQMPHLLDVARIAYIRNLEEGLGFPRDVIYTAAVLHDIGNPSNMKRRSLMRLREQRSQRRFCRGFPESFHLQKQKKGRS